MTHVDIREVSLRDGLQIEAPIPLSAKLELLEAVVATGVREIEATAFVSPSKVPALADAAALAAELPRFVQSHGIEFSALVAGPGGGHRRQQFQLGGQRDWLFDLQAVAQRHLANVHVRHSTASALSSSSSAAVLPSSPM